MHDRTAAFVERLGGSPVARGRDAIPNVLGVEDEVEEVIIEVMRLRREHRAAMADEPDPEIRGRAHEWESRLGAIEREARKLLEPLAALRKALQDLAEAHPRIQEDLTKTR